MIVAVPTKKFKRLERRKLRRMASGSRPYKTIEERNMLTAIFGQVTKLAKSNPDVRHTRLKSAIPHNGAYVGGVFMGNWMTSILVGIDGRVFHLGHHTNSFEKVYPIIAAACTKPMEEREAFFEELANSAAIKYRGDRNFDRSMGAVVQEF